MTPEEKAALRNFIEDLTIRDARTLADKSTETLRVLAELGIRSPHAVAPIGVATAPIAVPIAPGAGAASSPFPCHTCGRQFGFRGEEVKTEACDVCGLPIPATATYVTATNKGPIAWTPEEEAAREMRRLEREGS